jgi:hypothetical protein
LYALLILAGCLFLLRNQKGAHPRASLDGTDQGALARCTQGGAHSARELKSKRRLKRIPIALHLLSQNSAMKIAKGFQKSTARH